MPSHIVFFYATVIAGSALGLGCLAAGLYFELRGRGTKEKDDARRQKEGARVERRKTRGAAA